MGGDRVNGFNELLGSKVRHFSVLRIEQLPVFAPISKPLASWADIDINNDYL